MERQIDVLNFLSKIVQENTQHYQSDFTFDRNTLQLAAAARDISDRTFYWMSRPSGTWCVKEREVFIRGSDAHSIWTYYVNQLEHIKAYRITVTGEENGKVMGLVRSLDYRQQVQRVLTHAVPASTVMILYESGYTTTLPYDEYRKALETIRPRDGGIVKVRYEVAEPLELDRIIAREQLEQTREPLKPPQKRPRHR